MPDIHLSSHNHSYTQTTHDIRITVVPEYLPEQSSTEANVYCYAYHITIENLGAQTVKLIDRHWKIFSAGEQIGEVAGPGVVGKQPLLQEGQSFNYTSGTEVRDPVGYMEGTYTFVGVDGTPFLVQIPRFHLLYPMAIN